MSNAGIGSASCRRASLPATMRRPSRPHRERNVCCGPRTGTSKRRNIISTARCPEPPSAIPRQPASGSSTWTRVAAHHKQLRIWAANCPENFENRAALVGAEIARLEGRELDAERLYEQAIRSARANGFVHNEALAYELAARFYAARGFETSSRVSICGTPATAICVGAPTARCGNSIELYPHLREEEPAPAPTSTIGAPVEHLDLATVIKVSQAVSGEIVLEKLIDTLMRTAIEQAGAERGLLILPRGTEPRIEAEATTAGDAVIVHLRDEPVTAARCRSRSSIMSCAPGRASILDDAAAETPFAADPYIRQHQARSILCLPLLNQSQAHRRALPRKQPGPARLRAGPDRGAEAARLAGRDRAGEHPLVPRSRRTRSQDPAPGRRQHHRDLHLGIRRSDPRGQRRVSAHGGIRPRGSRRRSPALDGPDAAGMAHAT